MTRGSAIGSAETLAALRALATRDADISHRCEDPLAERFLGAKYRLLLSLCPARWLRHAVDARAPGSYGYTIARTRCFDDALRAALRTGTEQLVILGAGYDSRPFRFERELLRADIFEVDHPATQGRKMALLGRMTRQCPSNLRYIGLDLAEGSLRAALAEAGFSPHRRTLFLCEGVSYYLPRHSMEDVLDLVGSCAAGSAIVFDYALRSFVLGETNTYGGREIARWLTRMGEPFLFGLDHKELPDFLAAHNLRPVSDLGPEELERAYLTTAEGTPLSRTLGHARIVQAESRGVMAEDISPRSHANPE